MPAICGSESLPGDSSVGSSVRTIDTCDINNTTLKILLSQKRWYETMRMDSKNQKQAPTDPYSIRNEGKLCFHFPWLEIFIEQGDVA